MFVSKNGHPYYFITSKYFFIFNLSPSIAPQKKYISIYFYIYVCWQQPTAHTVFVFSARRILLLLPLLSDVKKALLRIAPFKNLRCFWNKQLYNLIISKSHVRRKDCHVFPHMNWVPLLCIQQPSIPALHFQRPGACYIFEKGKRTNA